ncbi:MAG: triple tyrosine motif-containing protein, partial [Christiangramia sp.]
MSKRLFIIIFLFSILGTNSQELPPVVNFGPNEYSAGNQNWMIAQAENENLYFANSTGLLEYNGEKWNLYPVPNNTIVRSLKVIGDRIYTGAYMEAGYWTRNKFGELVYSSLVNEFKEGISDGEQFWDIEFLDDLVIFRSFGGIYFYDPQHESVTKLENPLGKPIAGIFNVEDELFYQYVGEGLYKIENGSSVLVIPYDQLGDTTIMHLYFGKGELSVISGKTEFFVWKEQQLKKIVKPVNEKIGYPNILDAIDLPDGDLVLGTVGKGVVEIDSEGRIINSFNQENVLLNNTVLDLFIDKAGILWAGLDYGVSSIDLKSSFRSFQDNYGKIGSVYTSFEKDGALYLGTNQGLYLKKPGETKFSLIEGTNGQVWFVDEVDGKILCGQDSGTFLIQDDKALKICDRLGTWVIKEFSDDILIQGHYNGISFLRKNGGGFEALPMLPDFPHSSKFIEVDEDLNVWISNEHKGVFKMSFNDSLASIKSIENYTFPGESGITSSLFRFNDTIYYSSRDKIYQFNDRQNKFLRDNPLNTLITDLNRVSGKMIREDEQNKIWGFANEGIFSIRNARLSKDYDLEFIFIDQDFRNIAVGYENISHFGDSTYLLGIANGYLKFYDPGVIDRRTAIKLNKVEVSALDAPANRVKINEAGVFDYDNNNISFHYSAPVHDKYLEVVYSYRLLGLSPKWSEWSSTPEANFKNLSFGDYTFEVRSKVGNYVTDSARYEFNVQRPYYLSAFALI